MLLHGNILQANYFDLKNSINRQINGNLEPLKGYGINFLGSYYPLIYLNISYNKWKTSRNLQKTLFKFSAGVSAIYPHRRLRLRLQSFVLMKTTV
jgi:hypothetical protein